MGKWWVIKQIKGGQTKKILLNSETDIPTDHANDETASNTHAKLMTDANDDTELTVDNNV